MSLTALLALATLLIAAPINWYVVLQSWKVYRANRNPVAIVAFAGFLAVAVIVTVFALIFVNNDLAQPFLAGDATKIVTRVTLLAGGFVPPALWLWIYR